MLENTKELKTLLVIIKAITLTFLYLRRLNRHKRQLPLIIERLLYTLKEPLKL
jgi:hypothetical protein